MRNRNLDFTLVTHLFPSGTCNFLRVACWRPCWDYERPLGGFCVCVYAYIERRYTRYIMHSTVIKLHLGEQGVESSMRFAM
jgi:hypothetical protein